MKNLLLITLILIGVLFSACAEKKSNYSDRVNKASDKAFEELDREMK